MKNINNKNESNFQDRSQRQIENVKSKRHTKTVLRKCADQTEYEDEEMYSNFEKFNNRNK
jgi:hypothetical protein